MKAARLMAAGRGAAVSLRKNIPVSAGLGGGSSDAAAAIKLLSRLWNLPQPDAGLSARLGADLPVCLNGKPSRVEGIGERVTELPPLPPLSAVLVNPGHMLPTGEVYAAAAGIAAAGLPPLPRFDSAGGLAGWLRLQRNDLENTAVLLCPAVADVLTALRRCRNCLMARVSGSGATCFGLFDGPQSAGSAAALLRRGNPGWWVRETAV